MNVYVSTTPLLTSLPMNDNLWHKALSVTIPSLKAGQIVHVDAEQEVTNLSAYLAFVGSTVVASGIGSLSASMATDIQNGNHNAIHRGGAAVVPSDLTNVEVVLWIWAGSNYGSDPLVVEQAGYARLSVLVLDTLASGGPDPDPPDLTARVQALEQKLASIKADL
jgi:hypothetical protein